MPTHRVSRKPVIVAIQTGDDICAVAELLDQCSHYPGRYEVVVQPVRQRATASQRALYRIWLRQLARHIGTSPNELHEDLAREFLAMPALADGTETFAPESTADIEKSAMADYMSWIQSLAAAHFGLHLACTAELEESARAAGDRIPLSNGGRKAPHSATKPSPGPDMMTQS